MMHKKNDIVIGLTTFNNEMLQISIPALGKLHQKFTLIIHNNNPMTTIYRRQIRKLGYSGDLIIINSDENIGELRARLAIVDYAKKLNPKWFVFCDDDDLILDVETPNVSDDNFAIIQNAVVLRHSLCALLQVMKNTSNFTIDGENVVLVRPNIGILGTLIRADILFGLFQIISTIIDDIAKLDEKLDYYPPIDMMLWHFINTYARHINSDAVPIYMDRINYIKNDIDSSQIKYEKLAKPARNAEDHYQRALAKYDALLQDALKIAAAPRG